MAFSAVDCWVDEPLLPPERLRWLVVAMVVSFLNRIQNEFNAIPLFGVH
jgi:hypothetical protein